MTSIPTIPCYGLDPTCLLMSDIDAMTDHSARTGADTVGIVSARYASDGKYSPTLIRISASTREGTAANTQSITVDNGELEKYSRDCPNNVYRKSVCKHLCAVFMAHLLRKEERGCGGDEDYVPSPGGDEDTPL